VALDIPVRSNVRRSDGRWVFGRGRTLGLAADRNVRAPSRREPRFFFYGWITQDWSG
jgi:hypothetical protein